MSEYRDEVRANKFPTPKHEYRMPPEVEAEFDKALAELK
jgi:hypothetical protein